MRLYQIAVFLGRRTDANCCRRLARLLFLRTVFKENRAVALLARPSIRIDRTINFVVLLSYWRRLQPQYGRSIAKAGQQLWVLLEIVDVVNVLEFRLAIEKTNAHVFEIEWVTVLGLLL